MPRIRQPVTINPDGEIQCETCQTRFDWVSPRLRGGGKKPSFCSTGCAKRHDAKRPRPLTYSAKCLFCGESYATKDHRQLTCSRICGQRLRNGWKSDLPQDHWALNYGAASPWMPPRNPNPTYVAGSCLHCSASFVAVWLADNSSRYCSTHCRQTEARHRRRLSKRRAVLIEKGISWKTVAKRDGLACHICGDDCDPEDYRYTNNHFSAGITYPTVDHVYPLSKGGEHTWQNVKLAHLWCNSYKNAKVA
jgi:5-methylcytosine-specific restriction endonuclease McrA